MQVTSLCTCQNCRDLLNRCPLHIAVMCGSTTEVISCLIEHDKWAAVTQDIDGKTPLHIVFQNYMENWAGKDDDTWKDIVIQPMIEIISRLCYAAPCTATLEDNDGKSPLEYATHAEVSMEIVRILKRGERNGSLMGERTIGVDRKCSFIEFSVGSSCERNGSLFGESTIGVDRKCGLIEFSDGSN